MYASRWDDLPEIEVLANNFRRSVSGMEVGINYVRWEHPSGTPLHTHEDVEKVVIVLGGTIEWSFGAETLVLDAGTIAVVPRGVEHKGHATGATLRLCAAVTPNCIQNFVGFLGQALLPPATLPTATLPSATGPTGRDDSSGG